MSDEYCKLCIWYQRYRGSNPSKDSGLCLKHLKDVFEWEICDDFDSKEVCAILDPANPPTHKQLTVRNIRNVIKKLKETDEACVRVVEVSEEDQAEMNRSIKLGVRAADVEIPEEKMIAGSANVLNSQEQMDRAKETGAGIFGFTCDSGGFMQCSGVIHPSIAKSLKSLMLAVTDGTIDDKKLEAFVKNEMHKKG